MKKLPFETFQSQSLSDEAARVTEVGLQPFLCVALPLCYVLFVAYIFMHMPLYYLHR